jgi:hypothetical protein
VVAAWEKQLDRVKLKAELIRGPAFVEALEAADKSIVEQSTPAQSTRRNRR